MAVSIISLILTIFLTIIVAPGQETPYDIVVRDENEPFMASFQSKNGAYAVMSCGEYGFGASANAKFDTQDCTVQITFNFKWQGDKDFSFHPRNKPAERVTIKAGDIVRGEFTVDTCAKTAKGIIRDVDQNKILMDLTDANIKDSKGYCGGPPSYK